MDNLENLISPNDLAEIQEIKASLDEKTKFQQLMSIINKTANDQLYPARSEAAEKFFEKHNDDLNKLTEICKADETLPKKEIFKINSLIQDFENNVLSITT